MYTHLGKSIHFKIVMDIAMKKKRKKGKINIHTCNTQIQVPQNTETEITAIPVFNSIVALICINKMDLRLK